MLAAHVNQAADRSSLYRRKSWLYQLCHIEGKDDRVTRLRRV